MKRRQFLVLGSSTTAAAFLSHCPAVNPQNQSKNTIISQNRQISREGLVEVSLEAGYGPVNLAGQQAYCYSYNGQIPGPTIEARPGETVRIHLTNRLAEPTNLHYHGLHVPPTGKADNVFLSIPSGESFTYEFTIPQNHPCGTFMYHPHRHELVAQQIFGGLGGQFLIRGGLDDIPEIKAAQEAFLFLKDFALDGEGRLLPPQHMALMLGREGELVTVSGQINPEFSIPAGGLLRLRLTNASSSRFYRLALESHPFYLIARDGIPLAEPVELEELLLVPGERADLLVRGNQEPNQYRLLNLPYNRGGMGMMGGGMMGGGMMGGRRGRGFDRQPAGGSPHTLATLTYSGQVPQLPLPRQLLPVEALPETQMRRRFVLNHGMAGGMGMGMVFLINGREYNHDRVDTQVRLNSVEDWEIVNQGTMDHPFHLHTNPFQVISHNGRPEPIRSWKDTVLVRVGETVRLRVHFQDFAGKAVYHCHIHDHEDLGMMGVVEIRDF